MPGLQDVRYAIRSFRSKPNLPIAVISILAVGIGATTAVFSVVDRVLFRALPYGAAERLVSLGIRIPWLEFDFLTAGTYAEFRRDPGPLSAVTSWSGVADCDWTGDRPARLGCARVEATFLPVLGVDAALGRNFTPEEDRPGAATRCSDFARSLEEPLWRRPRGGGKAHRNRRPADAGSGRPARGFRTAHARSGRSADPAGPAAESSAGRAAAAHLWTTACGSERRAGARCDSGAGAGVIRRDPAAHAKTGAVPRDRACGICRWASTGPRRGLCWRRCWPRCGSLAPTRRIY